MKKPNIGLVKIFVTSFLKKPRSNLNQICCDFRRAGHENFGGPGSEGREPVRFGLADVRAHAVLGHRQRQVLLFADHLEEENIVMNVITWEGQKTER